MTVAELRALLLQYSECLRVLIVDHDGWLDERVDVEQRTINELGIGCAVPGERVVVIY